MKVNTFRKFFASLLSLVVISAIIVPFAFSTADAAQKFEMKVSSSVSSRYIGAKITLTGSATGGTKPYQYKFLYKVGNSSWTTFKSYSSSATASFTAKTAGKYVLRTYAKDKNNRELYCDLNCQVLEKYTEPVNNSTISSASVTKGKTVSVSGKGSGGTKPYYFKYYYTDQRGNTTTVKSYSQTSSVPIKFSTAGYYTVHCTMKDTDGKVLDKSFKVTVKSNTGTKLKNTSTISPATMVKGKKVAVNASASEGYQPYTYAYYYSDNNGSSYSLLKNYTESSYQTFTFSSTGYYKIKIIARDMAGNTAQTVKDLTVKYNTGKVLSVSSAVNTTPLVDKKTVVTVNAEGNGGTQPYQYSFRYRVDSGSWKTISGFSNTKKTSLKLSEAGKYTIQTIVKDFTGKQVSANNIVTSIASKSNNSIEENISNDYGLSLDYNIKNDSSTAKFKVFSRDPGSTQWNVIQEYNTNKEIFLRPRKLGTTAYMIYTSDKGTVKTSYFAVTNSIPQSAYDEVALLNKERKNAGLSEFKLDNDLQFAATVRAQELDVLYDHIRPDGTKCFTVLNEYGIKTPAACAENIAWSYSGVNDVVNGWMHSKLHKENIMCAKYTKIGVGMYKRCWSQLFTS